MSAYDPELFGKHLEAIIKWLEIREKNGYKMPSTTTELLIDAQHSALLERILSGKKIFDKPPPTAYSYPWYTLIENGYEDPVEVHEHVDSSLATYLNIGQTLWIVKEKLKNGWIAYHERSDTTVEVTPSQIPTKWNKYRVSVIKK